MWPGLEQEYSLLFNDVMLASYYKSFMLSSVKALLILPKLPDEKTFQNNPLCILSMQ